MIDDDVEVLKKETELKEYAVVICFCCYLLLNLMLLGKNMIKRIMLKENWKNEKNSECYTHKWKVKFEWKILFFFL